MTDAKPVDDADGRPLVSVVITAYNRPSYLRDAVESVLEQTYDRIELVIVDDRSDVPSIEAIEGIGVGNLSSFQYVRHETNRGANAARNTGIEASTGDYVAFLDDDDRWLPEKIEKQVRAFTTTGAEDVGVVYTGLQFVKPDSVGTEIPPSIDGDLTKHLLCRNVIGSMSVVMVRADLAATTPLDEEFPAWADLEWFIRLSRKATFERLPEPLVVYEYTSHGRLSDDFEKSRASYERFVDRFDDVASEYGPLFRRKMQAWAAFRVGSSALYTGNYGDARRFLTAAITTYPFEPRFMKYWLTSLGGRSTHRIARRLTNVTG